MLNGKTTWEEKKGGRKKGREEIEEKGGRVEYLSTKKANSGKKIESSRAKTKKESRQKWVKKYNRDEIVPPWCHNSIVNKIHKYRMRDTVMG